jgi:hypothetical protein
MDGIKTSSKRRRRRKGSSQTLFGMADAQRDPHHNRSLFSPSLLETNFYPHPPQNQQIIR